jgi:hypothetical protein
MQFLQSWYTQLKSSMRAGLRREKRPFEPERPKSREETPKWATVTVESATPPRNRAMSCFALSGNKPGWSRLVWMLNVAIQQLMPNLSNSLNR